MKSFHTSRAQAVLFYRRFSKVRGTGSKNMMKLMIKRVKIVGRCKLTLDYYDVMAPIVMISTAIIHSTLRFF